MKLTEALSELKSIKGRIARALDYRHTTAKHLKSEQPSSDFEAASDNIKDLMLAATNLKTSIAVANANTIVRFDDAQMPLQRLILMQGDVRSELAALKKMLGSPGKNKFDRDEGIFTNDYDPERYVYQLSKEDIEELILAAEKKKRSMDAVIQRANWETIID